MKLTDTVVIMVDFTLCLLPDYHRIEYAGTAFLLSDSVSSETRLVVIMSSELVSKEMVTVFVRYTTGDKVSFQIELTSSVKDLKEQVATTQNIESGLITLVFKGKVLKDEAVLESCGMCVV